MNTLKSILKRLVSNVSGPAGGDDIEEVNETTQIPSGNHYCQSSSVNSIVVGSDGKTIRTSQSLFTDEQNDEENEERTPLLQNKIKQRNSEVDIQLQRQKSHKLRICVFLCSAILSSIILTMSLIGAGINIHFYLSSSKYFEPVQEEYLGIASDVIQCARQQHWNYFPMTIIEEHMNDDHNDNPTGLSMEVFLLHPSDIIFHDRQESSLNYEFVLPDHGVTRFIIPYNYYNRPWYMWPGSTIKMTHNITSPDGRQPTEALAYLFEGDNLVNTFIDDTEDIPKCEQKIDLIRNASRDIFWKIQDQDYYFVAVHINGSKDTIFRANISFNLKYVDRDDYPWVSETSQHIDSIGDVAKFKLWGNENLTLCSLNPLDPSSPPCNSIHIKTSYCVNTTLALLVIALLFLVAIISACTICVCCCCYRFRIF